MSADRTQIGAPDPDDFSEENLLLTLTIARRALPYGAHPIHGERLARIEAIIRRHMAAPPPPPLPASPLSHALYPTQN